LAEFAFCAVIAVVAGVCSVTDLAEAREAGVYCAWVRVIAVAVSDALAGVVA
jgi:hypothetical protein